MPEEPSKSPTPSEKSTDKKTSQEDLQVLQQKIEQMMGPAPDDEPVSVPVTKHGKDTKAMEETSAMPPEVSDWPSEEAKEVKTPETDEVDSEETVTDIPQPSDSSPDQVTDDPVTNKAVDDIMAKESDEVLAAEDEKLAATFGPQKPSLRQRLKSFFVTWWGTPKYRWLTIGSLTVVLLTAGVVPVSRYFMLNTVGIRAGASVRVLDEKSQQPLKNVNVRLAGQTKQTDRDGNVIFSGLRLGPTELVVEKRAFAARTQKVTVGWGSNPFGEYKLTPTGVRYVFQINDFLSNKPLEGAEVLSGEASALSDEAGQALLVIDQAEGGDLNVTITLDTYRAEELTVPADSKDSQTVMLVPGSQQVFVSKRSGKYDLYKIDVDGKNEELLLAGTGSERDDMVVVQHPDQPLVALVSTRDNQRNKDGFLLSTLTVIDVGSGEATSLGVSERFQIVDWIGSRLVYVKIIEGSSAAHPERHRLIAYEHDSGNSSTLAASNYFNDVMSAGGSIYYAPSAAYLPAGSVGLFRIKADGSGKQTIMKDEVWNLFRTAYDKLSLSVQQNWYEYKLGDKEATKAVGPPSVLRSRVYVDDPENKQSLWVEDRDGKGTLLAYDLEAKSDKILKTQSGLKHPARWLNKDYVVYRINTDTETADYVMNLQGGEPKKIRDVTNTGGIDRWYYY